MNGVLLDLPPKSPEWSRISKFIAIALGLHGAVLLYPLTLSSSQVVNPPPAVVIVRLVDTVVPPAPLPLPVQAVPKPEPVPQARPVPKAVSKPRAKISRPEHGLPLLV